MIEDVAAYLSGLQKVSKKDDIPGTVEEYLDEKCPACGGNLKIMRPCCSDKRRKKVCGKCSWKSYLE